MKKQIKKTENANEIVANTIKKYRGFRCMTQKELGARLKKPITAQQISKYEKAESPATVAIFFEILDTLGVECELVLKIKELDETN